MIQQMIDNLLGKYSEFVKFQQDGTVKVFIPEDLNSPSKEGATEVVLTQKEAMNLMGLVAQPKQYAIGDRVVQESDPEFDINKWIKLALVIIKK